MDRLNGVFDQGFTGILSDSNSRRSTMPKFMEKLAEDEQNTKEAEPVETFDLSLEENMGLTRSAVQDDNVRDVAAKNRHTVEKEQKTSAVDTMARIEKAFQSLIYDGKTPGEAQDALRKKFPSQEVKQFFEASLRKQLDKYSHLGFDRLEGTESLHELWTKNPKFMKRKIARIMLKKFTKLDFVDRQTIRPYINKLGTEQAAQVVLSFVLDLNQIKRKSHREDVLKRRAFQRTDNQHDENVRDISNNKSKNATIKALRLQNEMMISFKEAINSGYDKFGAHKKLLKIYVASDIEKFYRKNINELERMIRFAGRSNRSNFESTRSQAHEAKVQENIDNKGMMEFALKLLTAGKFLGETKIAIRRKFGQRAAMTFVTTNEAKLQDLEKFYRKHANTKQPIVKFANQDAISRLHSTNNVAHELENREVIDTKKMMNAALQNLTNGKTFDETKVALKKAFGLKATYKFLEDNERKLQKHYGQIGYVFIDSNIYKDCRGTEMKQAFSNLKHLGSKLIYACKANSKCKGCVCNKEGTCEKVGLMLSNNPIVRSPRAARRVLEKAASFVPHDYIEKIASEINPEGGNHTLISKFTLGLKKAFDGEMKGRTASKDRSIDQSIYSSFDQVNTMNIDLFNTSTSKIIDSIL